MDNIVKDKSILLVLFSFIIFLTFLLLVLPSKSSKVSKNTGEESGTIVLNFDSLDLSKDSSILIKGQLIDLKKREEKMWSTQNIRKNPIPYLEHCKELLSSLRDQLLDLQFETRTTKLQILRYLEQEKEQIKKNREFIKEAENIIKKNHAGSLHFDGEIYSGEYLTNSIIEVDRKITISERKKSDYLEKIKNIDILNKYLKTNISNIENEIEQIPEEIEKIRATNVSKSAQEISSRINNLLDGVNVLYADNKIGEEQINKTNIEEIFKRNNKENTKE